MADLSRDELMDILHRYKKKVALELGEKEYEPPKKITSREYAQFKETYLPVHLSLYEKACNASEKILKVQPDPKKAEMIEEAIRICHLNVTPAGVVSFSLLGPLAVILFGSLISFAIKPDSFFFVFFFLLAGFCLIIPLGKFPEFTANAWRMRASNQMVLCIFYVSTYMRHSSNLERAIEFAAEHLAPPLSLDLMKVLWDVETEQYPSVKDSLEGYLGTWRKWNMEFIESFHMLESSLYEASDDRRLSALDKGLDIILNGTYEKMLHYAYNLKSPITMLHMLGVILPILGLVILPLIVSFMDDVKWYHIATLYNVTIPLLVFYLGKNILSQRPTGYGENNIASENPHLKKYSGTIIRIGASELLISPLWIGMLFGSILLLIGLSPLLFSFMGYVDIGWGGEDATSSCGATFCFLGFQEGNESAGPFGIGAALLSLCIPLALGLGIGMYYKTRSQNLIKVRERSKELEEEFAGALFQLGNRLGDGIPAENAVGKVASMMAGTTSGNFFQLVDANIRRLGFGIRDAIFHPRYGALLYYPSKLIESSMKVLTESITKGPLVAAQGLMNISRYIKEIHTVNERLKDLLAEIISSMSSQIKFLTPAISGIVVGITSMISTIMIKLDALIRQGSVDQADLGGLSGLDFGSGISAYYFQIIVGIYVVQITWILTILSNGVENGSDSLAEQYSMGKNLTNSTILYVIISLIIMLIFNMIAAQVLAGVVGV